MSLVFAVESLEDSWNDVILLAVDRWHQKGRVGEIFPPFNVQVQRERSGGLVLCTARLRGEMVGYAVDGDCFLLPPFRKAEPDLLKFAESKREARYL